MVYKGWMRRRVLTCAAGLGTAGLSGCLRMIGGSEDSGGLEAANFRFEQSDERLRIIYEGGGSLVAQQLEIRSTAGTVASWNQLGSTQAQAETALSSSATATIGPEVVNWEQPVVAGTVIRVVYMIDGESPTTLATFETENQARQSQPRQQPATETETNETGQPATGAVAEEALVGRWPFQSGFSDVAGDNDISIERGTPELGTYQGRESVSLDGSVGMMIARGANEELSIMASNSGPASIGGWVYFDQPSGMRHQDDDQPIHHIFRNDAEYVVQGVPVDDQVRLRLSIRSLRGGVSYSTEDHTTGEMTIPTNEWHHFMYVVTPQSSVRFYLDGEQRFVDENMPGYSPNVSDYWSHETVGSWYGTKNPDWYNLMVGKLADLRIYQTGLTGDKIEQIVTNTR